MSDLISRAFRPRRSVALPTVAPPSPGWTVESFRRSDPQGGPDTWLVVASRGEVIAFGSGLDEADATLRAFTSAYRRKSHSSRRAG